MRTDKSSRNSAKSHLAASGLEPESVVEMYPRGGESMMLALLLGALAPADGAILAVVNKGEESLSLINVASGAQIAKLKTGLHPQEVAFSPDGKTALVSNMGRGQQQPSRTLTIVDIATAKVTGEIDLAEHGAPHGIEFIDGNRALITSHATDSLVLVDVAQRKVVKAVSSGGKGTHLAVVDPGRKVAYAANVFTGDISILDLASFTIRKRIPCETRAEGVSVSPDGKWVAVGNMGADTVSIIDAQKEEVVTTLRGVKVPIRTFFTSDSQRMLVSCAGTGEFAVFSVEGWKETSRIKLQGHADLTIKGGEFPIPMNFARRAAAKEIFVAIINADAVVRIDEKTMKIVQVYKAGTLPDGIAVWG